MRAAGRRRARGAPLFLLALATACACKEEPAGPVTRSELLARRADFVLQQPGVLVPHGDIPGYASWGEAEGQGWSQKEFKLPDGTVYLETNQATAALALEAARPVDRDIELALWTARAANAEPGKLNVRLNGVELSPTSSPGSAPALLRFHAPAATWIAGDNALELSVATSVKDEKSLWDTLGVARVSYGPPALVAFDLPHASARFVDGTGARYALELAAAGEIELAGTATGAGTLVLATGTMDARTGERAIDADGRREMAVSAGPVSARIALARRAGALRTLELEWHAPAGSELALSSLALVEPGRDARAPIVLVSIDTFAAEHLSLYGYARRTSPALEEFQKDAVVFERCLANAPWTLPSYLSLMSGLYPRAHSVALADQPAAEIESFDRWQLAENRWTLAEALRARGYRTAGFVDTQWLSPLSGVNQGFDLYNGDGALALFADPTKHIQQIVEALVPAWLARRAAGEPWFLFVHALDAHGPYWPDEPFRDAFAETLPAESTVVPAGSINETYRTMPTWMARTELAFELRADEVHQPVPPTAPLERVIERYDEALLKVDAYLGKLLSTLRERGLYDDAVIVVTGDHGEHFGPDVYGHGVMHEDVLHVPLLVKLPHRAHAGLHVAQPVALVDIYPTLLALAGVPAESTWLHGTSLLPVLDAPASAQERVLFAEGGHVEQYALTQRNWRLVEERPGAESSEASLLTHPRVPEAFLRANFPEVLERPLSGELLTTLEARPGFAAKLAELRRLMAGPYHALYDLSADPHELRDLAAERPEIVAKLQPLLESERERSRSAQDDARTSLVRPQLSREARDKLHALGYGGVDDAGK